MWLFPWNRNLTKTWKRPTTQKMAERCVVWCAAVGDGKGKRSGTGKWCSARPSNEGV